MPPTLSASDLISDQEGSNIRICSFQSGHITPWVDAQFEVWYQISNRKADIVVCVVPP